MGTVSGGGARPSINISGSIRGYRPSSSGSLSGGPSGGTNVSSEAIDFTDFIVTPYDMDVYEGQEVTGSLGIVGAELDTTPWYVRTGGTIVVGFTSILSGVIDVVDSVADGACYIAAGACSAFGKDEWAETIREATAVDWADGMNEWLYGENGWAKGANEVSYMKYDSDVAQGIRKYTEKATQFAAATALTVFTGGLATAGVGFLYGMGHAAEDYYNKNGTDLTAGQNGMILLNGAMGALSWYSQGKLGNGLLEIGKSVNLLGLEDVLAQMKTEVFNKEFVKSLFTPGNVIGNAIASLMQSAGDIGTIATKLYNGEDVTAEEWALLVGELCLYFGLNTLEDGARSYISNFKINDDNAIKVAERLLDDTDNLSLKDILNINPASRQKVLDCLSPEEIAIGLEKLDPDTYRKIMDSLAKEDKLKVIYAQAKLAAEGKYDAFFLNFREHAALHTDEVRDYAVALATRVPGVDLDEVYYGAQFHDLGMRGGVYRDYDGVCRPIDGIGDTEVTLDEINKYATKQLKKILGRDPSLDELNKYMADTYGIENWTGNPALANVPQDLQDAVYLKRVKDYIADNLPSDQASLYKDAQSIADIPQELIDDSYRYTLACLARGNHPLNSAITILTEDVVPDGVDKNVVALLAMTHSKSTSGIKNFNDITEWERCITKLSEALADDGMDPEDIQKITDGLYDAIYDENTFNRLVNEALCIRDGDAMSLVPLFGGTDTIMQNGTHTHVSLTGSAILKDDYSQAPVDLNLTGKAAADAREAAIKAETNGIIDEIFDSDGTSQGYINNGFSKRTHAGELNVAFDSDYDGSAYIWITNFS